MPVVSPIKMDVPHNVSLSAMLLPRLLEHGDKVAMVEDDTGRHMTYRELVLNVKRLGAGLLRQGLRPGQVVTICANNCMDQVVLYYAIARIGCVLQGIFSSFPEDHIVYQVTHSDTCIIVTDTSTVTKINAIIHKCPSVKKIYLCGEEQVQDVATLQSLMTDEEGDDISDIDPNFDARKTPFNIVYTSGTTGKPKGVLRPQYMFTCSTWQSGLSDHAFFQPGDVSVVIVPLCGNLAQVCLMTHVMCIATKLILIQDGLDFPNYLRTVEKYKANKLWTLPSIMIKLANKSLTSGYDLSNVRGIIYGGQNIRTPFLDRLRQELTGIRTLVQVYGMSETGFIAMPNMTQYKPASCGILAPGGEIKVLDPKTGQELGPNIKGEMYFRCTAMMLEYVKNPEKTSEAIDSEGWLRTGDIGYYDGDNCLYVADRLKDIINYKTHMVFPSDLDTALLSHPGVVDVSTVGVKRADVGEIPYCFVVTEKSTDVTEFELRQILKESKESSFISDIDIEIVQEIPRSRAGKILLQELHQWANDKTIPRVPYTELTLRDRYE